MKIVMFTHPNFLNSQSMPRYAKFLFDGLESEGHNVDVLTAKSYFSNLNFGFRLKKWLGYIDQYIVFPFVVKNKLRKYPKDTLFVFADHALGPWVGLVKNRPHVIHCHDFLAQYSALGKIPENKTLLSGRIYQAYIRNGFLLGKNFISVSEKTKNDLTNFLKIKPRNSFIVYNALNPLFLPIEKFKARSKVMSICNIELSNGYLLQVGGNSWYKNRVGVIMLYNAWRKISKTPLPLIMVGEPSDELINLKMSSSYCTDIYFILDVNDKLLNYLYSGSKLLIFPSLDEGFGWPIIEAMASGCPVLTTNIKPMTEVGGNAAIYIDRMPHEVIEVKDWAKDSANIIENLVTLNQKNVEIIIENGIFNAKRFKLRNAIKEIEGIYMKVIQEDL